MPVGQFLKIDQQQKTPALTFGGQAFDFALVVPPPIC
jgi:hypothetical protein